MEPRAIDDIEKLLKPIKKISCPIRWIDPKNHHITLKFIGEVSDQKYLQIEKGLIETAQTLNIGDIDLKLTGCGKFGPKDAIRIFWVGLIPNPSLNSLYEEIENCLFRLGIAKEDRPFSAHITVGRNNKAYNFKRVFEYIEELKDRTITGVHVTHFQLFKSDLLPEGPVYTVLKEIPLAYS